MGRPHLHDTDEEREISPREEKLCQEYARNGGQAGKAAIFAGYSQSFARTQIHTVLERPHVKAYLKSITAKVEAEGIASIIDIQQFWTNIYQGKVDDGEYPAKLSDRIKASELLAKSKGGFLDKVALVDTDGKSLPTINLNFVKADKE